MSDKTPLTAEQLFDIADPEHDEYSEFERIPESDRRHSNPLICALLFMVEKMGEPEDGYLICNSEHGEIWFGYGSKEIEKHLTVEDVRYLRRCSISYDRGADCLHMFT